jgi:hypothetical protein
MCRERNLCDKLGFVTTPYASVHVGILPSGKRLFICVKERGLSCQHFFLHWLTFLLLVETVSLTVRKAFEFLFDRK